MKKLPPSSSTVQQQHKLQLNFILLLLLLLCIINLSQAQQTYIETTELYCDRTDTKAIGFLCINASTSCSSYLTFRSQPPFYDTPTSIATLLHADPVAITRINRLSSTNSTIPSNTLLIIPISNCSCSSSPLSHHLFYEYNASYILQTTDETYFTIANNTFEGLTTCQALINHSPNNYRHLAVGMNISIPLRCACPTPNQTAAGIRYMLTYLVTWEDSIESITSTFGISDPQTLFDANKLSSQDLIFPFTPILIPLMPKQFIPYDGASNHINSSRTCLFVGIGIGIVLLLLLFLSGFLVWYFCRTGRARVSAATSPAPTPAYHQTQTTENVAGPSNSTTLAIPTRNPPLAVSAERLTVYKYQDLEAATGYFTEENRLRGQVYRGNVAVKIMEGDVSGEINILKQINHANIIKLSGFCLHQGNTYLVFEHAENGSLNTILSMLSWKERVQIAYDIANALNYIHNFTNPPHVHKNLKSSNVLLDSRMRAKITNFGLARSMVDENEGMQLTKHVVGTYGYMPPEYIENGLITPKMDVFAFGVIMLELLSGKESAEEELQLSARIKEVLGGENVREKLDGFVDDNLKHEYPFDLVYSMAQLASSCVAHDLNSRPSTSEVLLTLSKSLSASTACDPSD